MDDGVIKIVVPLTTIANLITAIASMISKTTDRKPKDNRKRKG